MKLNPQSNKDFTQSNVHRSFLLHFNRVWLYYLTDNIIREPIKQHPLQINKNATNLEFNNQLLLIGYFKINF